METDTGKILDQFREFLIFCKKQLGLKKLPKIHWFSNDDVGISRPSFGSFENATQEIRIGINNRHPLDIMRTLAHELTHYKQFLDGKLQKGSGETGSPQENEANALAGIIMRDWNAAHEEMFKQDDINEHISESIDNTIPDNVLEFLDSLGSDDVGKERIDDFVVHFEGFSDICQSDAEERTNLPVTDPRYLCNYDAVYQEVIDDFIKRESGSTPVATGLAGDQLYPVVYAVFHKPILDETEINRIDQFEYDGGSLEGYVVDTDQPQLENYLTSQGASIDLVRALQKRYHRIGIIRNMWVDEDLRGGGIGSDMLEAAIGDAFAFGADAIMLVADMAEDNTQLGKPLDQWYAGWGFKAVGSAGGDPVMILDRNLSESWSKKYKKSINCSNPKGFSQKAHCAGRRARQAGKKTKSKSVSETIVDNHNLIEARKAFLAYAKSKFPRMPDYVVYELIYKNSKKYPENVTEVWTKYYGSYNWKQVKDFKVNENTWDRETSDRIRARLGSPGDNDTFPKDRERFAQQRKMIQQRGVSQEPIIVEESREQPGKYTLLEGWHRTIEALRAYPQGYVCPAYVGSPTATTEKIRAKAPESFWQKLKKKVLGENFADGKGPGRPGDSQRHGIPKGATIAQLEKAAKAKGRKGQLARWQLNMRRGGAKNESETGITGKEMLKIFNNMHHETVSNLIMDKFIKSHDWKLTTIDSATIPALEDLFDIDDPFDRVIDIDEIAVKRYVHKLQSGSKLDPIIMGPNNSIIDGNHRALAYKELQKPILAYVPIQKLDNPVVAETEKQQLLDKPTPTVGNLAEKYHTSLLAVQQQLTRGIRVEMEHTSKYKVAKEIALDHLGEDLYYYKKLANAETPKLDELKIDNVKGAGAVPDNQNVDYLGLRVQMKPSMFLKLAHKLTHPESVKGLAGHIEQGGAIGAPFLVIEIPREWWDNKFEGIATVKGHEGRNRMMAIQQVEGNDPVEVHLFFRGEVRARHLTPEIIEQLTRFLRSQDGNLVSGPIFST